MQGNKWVLSGVIIALLLFNVHFVLGDVVVFDSYKTTLTMNKGSLHVTKSLRLKNVGTSPIIPGEIHFKISQNNGKEDVAPVINNFVVTNKYDKKLDTKQIKNDNEIDLVFTIWDPLLPQFFYDFTMEYDIDFKPKGLMFYEINIPEEKTTIAIRASETEFILPKKYFITYAPDAEISSGNGKKVLTWDQLTNLKFEYSVIPMVRMGFPTVNLFWILVILLLLVIFIIRIILNRR